MLVLEAKDVGMESERVFVSMEVELGVGDGGVEVGEDEGEGGRKVMLDFDTEIEEVGEGVKTGGQGGKVGDEKLSKDERVEDERTDDAVSVILETDLEDLGLDDAVGMLKLTLEGNSKVMDDGMSGTDVEYDG